MIAPPRRGIGLPARALNTVLARLLERGLPLPGLRLLRVHGRRSGRLRSRPLLVPSRRGRRYLVAPRGETDWTRNLRAAGWGELIRGSRIEAVAARELHGEERIAVLALYLRRHGWLTRRLFGLPRGHGEAQVRAIAERHPAFEVTPRSRKG